MDRKSRIELRVLKAYAALSSIILAVLLFSAAKTERHAKFDEIDVERINIVENGKLRLTISNNERSPGNIMRGKTMQSRAGKRGAGFIFFNDEGDEQGGMTWRGATKDGHVSAGGELMFDQYDQDQTVGIEYSQENDKRTSGLRVWERPLVPISDLADKIGQIELMPDGPEKTAALKKVREEARASGVVGVPRVFVGRSVGNDAEVQLSDTKGKPRIVMSVDGSDVASLKFLDANGNVVFTLPDKAGSH